MPEEEKRVRLQTYVTPRVKKALLGMSEDLEMPIGQIIENLLDGACRIMTAASGLLHADITVFSHWLETKGMRDDESMDDFIVRKYGADALRVVNNLSYDIRIHQGQQ